MIQKLMLCSVLLVCFLTNAQTTTTVQGHVKDIATGKSIPNVTITVLNAENGTTSDDNGKYSITLKNNENTLKFSAVGYLNTSKKIGKSVKTLNIALEPSITELKEVLVTGKNTDDLSVNKVSKIALKLRPINTAQDLLKTVPGLFIAQHTGGGKAEQIFLRGFDNDHGTDFAVFTDGIPVNLSSHAHGQGYADLHFLIPETVGDANYYKGPHEIALGNFAVSGAALYTTKSRLTRNAVKLEYGQYDFMRALAMLNVLDNKNFLTKNYENAYVAIEGTHNNGFFTSNQNLKRLNSFSKYTVDINDKNTLTSSLSTFHSSWNASGQIPLRAVQKGLIGRFGALDDTEGGDTKRIHFNTQLQSELSENSKLNNQLYYVSNQYNLFSNFTFFQNDPVNGDMIHQFENRHVFGYQGKLSINSTFGQVKSKTVLGLGAQHNNNNISLNNSKKRKLLSVVNNSLVNETNYNIYAKQHLKLSEKLDIIGGLRADVFDFNLKEKRAGAINKSNTAFRISPKFNLFYAVTPKVKLYAKASSGFHSNYTHAAVENKSVPPLPRAMGYDLGTEFKISNQFIGNIAGWYLESDAEYVYVTDGFEYENKGRSKRLGADASFRYQPLSYFWLDTDLNYSYGTLLDEPKEANKIPAAPRFTSTGGATLRLKNGIKSALRYRYMAERPLIEDESVIADSYFLLDAVVNYTKPKYEIGLALENIFNEKWMEAVFYDSSQLKGEPAPVNDFHFTPGTPFLAKLNVTYFF